MFLSKDQKNGELYVLYVTEIDDYSKRNLLDN
jgi:hypothetical protein